MTLKVTESEVIKAKWAPLPCTSMKMEYYVQVLEPIELIPEIVFHSVLVDPTLDKKEILKELIKSNWRSKFAASEMKLPEVQKLHGIEVVELIECELLAPKHLVLTECQYLLKKIVE